MKLARVFLSGLLALALFLTACQASPSKNPPLLVPGDPETRLPDTELDTFLYVNPGGTFSVSGEMWQLPPGVKVTAQAAALWLQGEGTGVLLRLTSPEEAQALAAALPGEPELAFKATEGPYLRLVSGSGTGAEALKRAVASGKWVDIRDKYPEIWNTLSRLPGPPATRMAAVGFLRFTMGLTQGLGRQPAASVLANSLPALGQAGINHAAFGVYGERVVDFPGQITEAFLKEAGVTLLFATRPGYPAMLVSWFFGSFMGMAGAEAVTFDGHKAYATSSGNLRALLQEKDGYIYAAVATEDSQAQRLLIRAVSAQ